MLSFFRRNLFINLIFLLLFVVVLQVYFLFKWSSPEVVFSIGLDITQGLGVLSNNFIQSFLTIALILVQAVLVSRFVIDHRMSRALSYIPGAIFILFTCFALEDSNFDVILFANLFFILSIGNLYNIYKKYRPVTHIFNAGLFLSIAALIYFPYIIFFFVLIMGLLSLRNTNAVEMAQLIIGFLAGFFLCGVVLYATGHFDQLMTMVKSESGLPDFDFSNSISYLKVIISIIIILVLVMYQTVVKKKKNFDAIRKIDLNYWILFFALISLVFLPQPDNKHLILLSLPVGILGGLVFERKEGVLAKEFVFVLMLVLYCAFVFDVIQI
ncbi:MAG: hypothetical protein HKN09_06970 [Saprospiraceae bacterium]|nr:hypothetical protein [Saprospiraceae bacterium]